MHIFFVCKGNICRSAYAEAKLRQSLASLKLKIEVASFGLETTPGKPADPDALRIAKETGIDLSEHKTKGPPESFPSSEALFFCMEPWQKREVRKRLAAKHVFSLSDLAEDLPLLIQDPYGKSDEFFRERFKDIDKCLENLLSYHGTAEKWSVSSIFQ